MSETLSPEWETHIDDSAFMQSIMRDVYGPRKGGAVIFIDAQNARRGIAKTSAKVAVARYLAKKFGYELTEADFTLSGDYYLKRAIEHPGKEQPSVLGIDEFVGAGAGDKRRSMAEQNVFFGKVWQMLREKRVITLATLPDWNEADKRLRKYADYRLWCIENPIGHFQPYKVKVPFQASESNPTYLQGLGRGPDTERITFPNMDAQNDPLYDFLTSEKSEVIDDGSFDGDALEDRIGSDDEETEKLSEKEIEKNVKREIALNMYKPWTEQIGMSAESVGHAVGMSDGWVSELGRDWRRGSYRNLVPTPDDEPTDAIDEPND